VRIMEKHVGAPADLCQRCFLGRTDIVEAADETRQHTSVWAHRLEAALETVEGQLDRRQLDSTDCTGNAGLRHRPRQDALNVGRLLDLAGQPGDVDPRSAARRYDQ